MADGGLFKFSNFNPRLQIYLQIQTLLDIITPHHLNMQNIITFWTP